MRPMLYLVMPGSQRVFTASAKAEKAVYQWLCFFSSPILAAKSTKAIFKPLSWIEAPYPKGDFSQFGA
jgi:hypothetical protein